MRPTLTQARQTGTQFIYPGGMEAELTLIFFFLAYALHAEPGNSFFDS